MSDGSSDELEYRGPGRLIVLPPGVSGVDLTAKGGFKTNPWRKAIATDCQAPPKECPQASNHKKMRCPQGHPYSKENTRVTGRGFRVCRTCERARHKEDRGKKRAGVVAKG